MIGFEEKDSRNCWESPPPAVSLSLFLDMSDLEIEANLACMATLFWAEAVCIGEDLERNAGEERYW